MKNIFCIGEALIDRYKVNNETKDQVGGAPLNVAGALAYLKNQVYFLGSIGSDVEGEKILKLLKELNIQSDLVQITKTPTTVALVELNQNNGERNFKFIRGSDENYEIPPAIFIDFPQIDFCHFSSATALLGGKLKESYLKLAQHALDKGIPVGFDPNFRDALWTTPKEIEDFKKSCEWYLQNAHLIKVSDEELFLLTGEKEIELGLKTLATKNPQALICATQGSLGATYAWKGAIRYCSANSVQHVVDTTGAGDAFVAYLIHEFIKFDSETFSNLDFAQIDDLINQTNAFARKAVKYYGALTFLTVEDQIINQ